MPNTDAPLEGAERLSACLPKELDKPRLRREHASQYLDYVHGITIAPATLAKLACIGGGPAYFKVVRTPLYPREELDAWAAQRLGKLIRSTSEEAANG